MHDQRTAMLTAAAALLLIGAAAVMLTEGPATAAAGNADPLDRDNGGSMWGANYFPNVALTTHDGRTVRFFDDLIKGKVVAINFIYTTCPDSCPMETARLLEVYELLGEDRMGRDVFFYSITIDPEHDTQPVLAKFAKDWRIGAGWSFLTGKEEDITLLRKKLGLYIEEIQAEGSRDHNLSLIIGNQATGRWMKRSPFENAHVLAIQIGGELHNWKIARTSGRDYADAPELRTITKGESLFRTRCSACHTIGGGDVKELAARRIGPDLYKVTERRDRAWLERWLAAPDAMLEEKDPLAMALLAQYNDVPMPNMQLNPIELQAVIEHLEEESAEIAKHVAMGHRRDPLGEHHAEHSMDHHAGHSMDPHAGHR